MPDLETYALPVLGAYAAALGLMAALVLATWLRGRAVKRRLDEAEARRG
jgi:heme exporter protein D